MKKNQKFLLVGVTLLIVLGCFWGVKIFFPPNVRSNEITFQKENEIFRGPDIRISALFLSDEELLFYKMDHAMLEAEKTPAELMKYNIKSKKTKNLATYNYTTMPLSAIPISNTEFLFARDENKKKTLYEFSTLTGLEEAVYEWESELPIFFLRFGKDQNGVLFYPDYNEEKYEYIFEKLDFEKKQGEQLVYSTYTPEGNRGDAQIAHCVDDENNLIILCNAYNGTDEVITTIKTYDDSGNLTATQEIDTKDFLDLSSVYEEGFEDAITRAYYVNDYLWFQTQHSRFLVYQKKEEQWVKVDIDEELEKPLNYYIVRNVAMEDEFIYFCNKKDNILVFNTKNGEFTEIKINIGEEYEKYWITDVIKNKQGDLVFVLADHYLDMNNATIIFMYYESIT